MNHYERTGMVGGLCMLGAFVVFIFVLLSSNMSLESELRNERAAHQETKKDLSYERTRNAVLFGENKKLDN